ncbi:DUF4344 domain-containing metallopeptidase [Crocosphaera sp. Alani8]|uniref:DUF4344 domain-containing metallopeptidase n=1 Tax=Crocosphaera sp. Alani8 TaxID=3038952 RepID=UPI00313DE55F
MNYQFISFKVLSKFFFTLFFITLGLTTPTTKNEAQNNKVGRFILQYQPSSSNQEVEKLIRKTEVFDLIISNLNSSGLIMREDISVLFKDCGTANAFWSPSNRQIIICYENTSYDVFLFHEKAGYPIEEALDKSINETIVTFYHELGHGLIDVLSLSAVGKEEDTVDEFAVIMLFRTFPADVAAEMVLDASEFYELLYKEGRRSPRWGEHAPHDKRLFNLVCLVYGSNPQKYAKVFIEKFELLDNSNTARPEQIKRRARMCQSEFVQKMDSWNKLLLPHYATENPNQTGNKPSGNFNGSSRRGTHW